MSHRFGCAEIALIGALAAISTSAAAQTPQPGYYDIPAGFDFPANKQTLEGYRTSGNVSAQRTHVWNVFAGMTQSTPDGKYAIFETWYSEAEAFDPGATLQAVGPRRVVKRFSIPRQFAGTPGQPALEAAGDVLLSEVMLNFANYNFIRSKKLYSSANLQNLLQTGQPDPEIANDKTVPAFPAESVSLKTVWWPVAKDKPTPMPIWDPETNPSNPRGGNPYSTWTRAVVIDPTRSNIPPDETMTVNFHGPKPNSHVVGLDQFHYVLVDEQTAANANANGRLAGFIRDVLGRPLQAGDYAVFAGTHLTTKEIDDWVWATFWWHDRPDAGPFAADRPDTIKGPWRNYLMSASYDLNLPLEPDGKPHITFNPWLEAGFRVGTGGDGNGTVSNCMNCHHRASIPVPPPPPGYLPIYRGNPNPSDPAYIAGVLRTDYLWSIPFSSQ